MHTFITGNRETDHRNHDGLDNRRDNLRNVTHSQNQANHLPMKNSTSKYKGVCWKKREQRWIVQVGLNGRQKQFGLLEDELEAAIVYDIEAFGIHGEYSYLNCQHFPEVERYLLELIEG